MDVNKAYELISTKLTGWLHDFIRLLPNMLMSAVILVLGFYLASFIKKIALKLISKISVNGTLNQLFSSVVYVFFIGIVIFIVLSILQLDKAVTSILAGAGILGLALAFAFQDIASNFMSGIFISIRKPINIGDTVSIKTYTGTVAEINLRDTVIKTFQGQMVIIPNKEVFQHPIENFSMLGKRRIDLNIGISYGEDLEAVKQITLKAVEGISGLCEDEKITMFYQEFGDSSINFTLRMWVSLMEQSNYLEAWDTAVIRIKKAYDANHIMIPFPIRTMDFGIKGGKGLDEMMAKNIPEKKEN